MYPCFLWLYFSRLLLVRQGLLYLGFVPGERGGERNRVRVLYLENFKPHSFFSFFPKDRSVCLRLLNPLSVESLCEHTSVRARVPPCSRLFSAHCRTSVCIFLVHGSFHCHTPKQLESTVAQCW